MAQYSLASLTVLSWRQLLGQFDPVQPTQGQYGFLANRYMASCNLPNWLVWLIAVGMATAPCPAGQYGYLLADQLMGLPQWGLHTWYSAISLPI